MAFKGTVLLHLALGEVAGGGGDVAEGHVLVVAVAVLVDPAAELPVVVRLAPQVHLAAPLKWMYQRLVLSIGCTRSSSSTNMKVMDEIFR